MIAIIPCAGKGTRRYPDTKDTPKILLEHEGTPVIEHILEPIYMSGKFKKIVFVLNHKQGQQIIDYLTLTWGAWQWGVYPRENEPEIKFVWQAEPLGFGHAVLQAKSEVNSLFHRSTPVFVHTDDAIISPMFEPKDDRLGMVQHMAGKQDSQIGVQWRDNAENYGVVITDNNELTDKLYKGYGIRANLQGNRITHLLEKNPTINSGLAITGQYFIRESRLLFKCLEQLVERKRKYEGEYQFTHALQMMVQDDVVFRTYPQEWIDIGKAENEDFGEDER